MKTRHLDRYGIAYLIAICLTLNATLNSIAEIFSTLTREAWAAMGWWQILAMFAKSLSAAPTALVAYLIKSPLASASDSPPPAEPAKPIAPAASPAAPGEAAGPHAGL